jgi:diadenylate cyclase
LGASEIYDAYIVVVSEETGAISLAVNGRLERPLTEEQLRNRLMELVAANDDENANSIRKRIRDYAQVEIPLGRSDKKGGRNK